jgi:hypothetical protein
MHGPGRWWRIYAWGEGLDKDLSGRDPGWFLRSDRATGAIQAAALVAAA